MRNELPSGRPFVGPLINDCVYSVKKHQSEKSAEPRATQLDKLRRQILFDDLFMLVLSKSKNFEFYFDKHFSMLLRTLICCYHFVISINADEMFVFRAKWLFVVRRFHNEA